MALYARDVFGNTESPAVNSGMTVLNAGALVTGSQGFSNISSQMLNGYRRRWRATGSVGGFTKNWTSASDNNIPMTVKLVVISVVTSWGGLHHISFGIGDPGVSVVPQTLHTIDLGVSA